MRKLILALAYCLFLPFSVFSQLDAALLEAVKQNELAQVDSLIRLGADVNVRDTADIPALMWAVYQADLRVVKMLYEAGASTDFQAAIYLNEERTAYYGNMQCVAAGKGKLEILRYLIEDIDMEVDEQEFNPKSGEKDGWTALQWGCSNGRLNIAKYLVQREANFNVMGGDCLLLSMPYQRVFDFILSLGIQMNELVKNKIIVSGVKKKQYNSLNAILKSKIIINQNRINLGALLSVGLGDLTSFHIFYSYGVDTSSVYKGETLRSLALKKNNHDITWYLNNPHKGKSLLIWKRSFQRNLNLYDNGKYFKALKLSQENVLFVKKELGDDTRFFAIALTSLAANYKILGEYEKAKSFYEKALTIREKVSGKKNLEYASSLNNLGIILGELKDYEEGIDLLKESLKIMKEKSGVLDMNYITTLESLGLMYSVIGDKDKGLKICQEVLELRKSILGEKHPYYALSLSNVGILYFELGRYISALPMYREALRIRKKTLGEENLHTIQSMNNLASLYKDLGKYHQALPLFKKVMFLRKKKAGKNGLLYIKSLNSTASIYYELGNYEKALQLFEESQNLIQRKFGKNDKLYVDVIINLATVLLSYYSYRDERADSIKNSSLLLMGELLRTAPTNKEKATNFIEEAYSIIRDSLGIGHKNFVPLSISLGRLYEQIEDDSTTKRLFKELIELKEKRNEKDKEYIRILIDSGNVLHKQGKYKEALEYFKKVEALANEVLPKKSLTYAEIMQKSAQFYCSIEDFQKAENMLKGVLDIKGMTIGKEHPQYALVLLLQAEIFISNDKLIQAKKNLIKGLRILENSVGKQDFGYAKALSNLATVYSRLGNIKEAIRYNEKALSIIGKTQGKINHNYVSILRNLAKEFIVVQEFQKAKILLNDLFIRRIIVDEDTYIRDIIYWNTVTELWFAMNEHSNLIQSILERNLNTLKKKGIENHPTLYISTITKLASLYKKLELFDKSEKLYLEAAKLSEELYGVDNKKNGTILEFLAFFYIYKNEILKSIPFLEKSKEIEKKNFITTIIYLSEDEKFKLVQKLENRFDLIAAIGLKKNNEKIQELIFNDILFKKEFLIQLDKMKSNILLENKDPIINSIITELKLLKKLINKKLSLVSFNKQEVESLEKEQIYLEEKLINNLPEYHKIVEILNINGSQVQKALGQRKVAIEFIKFRYHNNKHWTDTTYYAALVLRSHYTRPKMVLLGRDSTLQELLKAKNTSEGIKQLYTRSPEKGTPVVQNPHIGKKLYNFVWSKLDTLLDGVEEIYYAPAGNLHQVAFAGLPIEEDSLLCQKYKLHQVGTTRELVTGIPDIKAPKKGKWLLAGGINYKEAPLTIDSLIAESTSTSHSPSITLERDSRNELAYLEGTQKEVDTLAHFLQNQQIDYQLWKGNTAYEERFHQEDSLQNYDLLHIATHGYFFSAPKDKKEQIQWQQFGQPGLQFRKIDRPLMRSGLILSGAEKAWLTGETYPNRMDGIWTAQEISELNLKNTKLAVLSACETGLGKIEGNEGVYGLQRAFKLAGVEKLLVSLWKVNDEATSQYMQQFYKNWLNGGTAYEAYRKTQSYFIQHKKFSNPYYWAGFVFME